jgi:pimeloyl-ACP methyl ester carboxylesterase
VPPLQSIQVNGFSGCFSVTGQGRDVVLLVSPYSRVAVYWPVVVALARRFTVTAIEPPGCGCGSPLDPAWDLGRYADWLAQFLITRKLNPATLVGHSNSAAIGAMVAATRPGLLDKLILVDPVGGDGPHAYVDFLAGAAVCAALELRFALRLIPRGVQNLRRHAKTIVKQLEQSGSTDLRSIAAAIRTPTLLAWGGMDCVMPLAGLQRLHRLLPGSATYVYPHGNHDWLIEHPEVFASVARAFIYANPSVKRQYA